jgi:hypothetical protein
MTENLQPISVTEPVTQLPYTKPAIVHELKLETRAGSSNSPILIDPLGIDPNKAQGS